MPTRQLARLSEEITGPKLKKGCDGFHRGGKDLYLGQHGASWPDVPLSKSAGPAINDLLTITLLAGVMT